MAIDVVCFSFMIQLDFNQIPNLRIFIYSGELFKHA